MMQDTFELVLHPIVDTRIEQIVENGVVRKLMILGNDRYYITDINNLFHLVSKTCIDKLGINGHPAPNVLHYTCEWGISLIDKNFNGIFKILNKNTVIAEDMEDTWGQFIFKEFGGKKYLYDPLLFKQCEERLTKYFPHYNDNGFWSAVLNSTKVENITSDNLMQYAVKHINCGVFKIRHGGDSKCFTNTIKNYVESTTVLPETTAIIDDAFNSTSTQQTFIQNITDTAINLINDTVSTIQDNIYEIVATERTTVLPETTAIIDDAFNSTITNSTAEISESIFSDNTESWTETGINLINNTVANLNNTAFNSTYNPQENMFDESDNDTSLVAPYIKIGIAGIAVIGVAIVAGLTWYVRNKNAKKAKLKQYIDEIEAERAAENKLAANDTEEHNAPLLNNSTEHNDHTTVDMTGVSYDDEGTPV